MYRILIVEDDAVIASALEKHLETWGWIVKTVENFENVLGEFTSFEPQLVLLDISLPFITDTTGAVRSGQSPECR